MNERQYKDFLILYPILSNVLLLNKIDIDYLYAFRQAATDFTGKGDSKVINEKVNILDVMQHALTLECACLEKVEGINDTIAFIKELGSVEANDLTLFHNFISHKGYTGEYVEMLQDLAKAKHRRPENGRTSK